MDAELGVAGEDGVEPGDTLLPGPGGGDTGPGEVELADPGRTAGSESLALRHDLVVWKNLFY